MRYTTVEFETLYINCFPASMKLAMTLLHDEDEARDVVQEIFVKLWESEVKIEKPLPFVVRSVRNACLNRINMIDTRERIRQKLTFEAEPDDHDIEVRNEEIKKAIGRLLTPREQQVVAEIYASGNSYKETARNLDISVASVNKNIVSALKKLRNHFKSKNHD